MPLMSSFLQRVKYSLGIGWIIIVTGLLAIIGWQFDIARLRSLVPGLMPVNPLIAIMMVLSGAWLLINYYAPRLKFAEAVIEWLIILTGLIHLTSYILDMPSLR